MAADLFSLVHVMQAHVTSAAVNARATYMYVPIEVGKLKLEANNCFQMLS